MILAQVRSCIRRRGLIEPGQHVLAAISGGPDSAAMLLALSRLSTELGFDLTAASVDHGLRAEASADLALARQQAETVGVAFHPLTLRLAGGADLQARARVERYRVLLALAAELGAQRVATGHTRDDQAETVLMRLLRGAGMRGLGAVEPRRGDGVIRPLIDSDRLQVHEFARDAGLKVALDPSNEALRFERVRVRKHLLPELRQEDPALIRHLSDLADDARDALQVLAQLASAALEQACDGSSNPAVSVLLGQPRAVRREALRSWLCEQHQVEPGRAHLEQLDALLANGQGEVWLPRDRVAQVVAGRLKVGALGTDSGPVQASP